MEARGFDFATYIKFIQYPDVNILSVYTFLCSSCLPVIQISP